MFVFYNTKDFATITRSTEPTKEENATNEKFKPEKTLVTLFKTRKHECELCDNEEEKSNTTTDLEALMFEDNNNDIREAKSYLKRKVRKECRILLEYKKEIIASNRKQ